MQVQFTRHLQERARLRGSRITPRLAAPLAVSIEIEPGLVIDIEHGIEAINFRP